jgi:glycosyltransferase involved in cell wall biosynthesis
VKKKAVQSKLGPTRVILVGPTPPPVHGVSQVIGWLLESPTIPREMLLHLDTSDRRSLENLGRVDLQNLLLGIKNVMEMLWLSASKRPSLMYYTLSPNAPALLREALLVSVARLFGVKAVVQLAGNWYFDIAASSSLAGRLIRRALENAALVLVLGQRQVQPVLQLIQHNRVGVAPNGLTPPREEVVREEHSGPCCFLYLGALATTKGLMVALEALAAVVAAGRTCQAVFAGSWPSAEEEERIRGRVEQLELSGSVEFPGVVTGCHKEALFRRADVYWLPSFAEGQPVSIIEAMAHRLPVVSTKVGAVPDTVIDGETGILVEPGDVAALVTAIERVVDSPDLRERLGRAGERRFFEQFTLERSHTILMDYFLRVARGADPANGGDLTTPSLHETMSPGCTEWDGA